MKTKYRVFDALPQVVPRTQIFWWDIRVLLPSAAALGMSALLLTAILLSKNGEARGAFVSLFVLFLGVVWFVVVSAIHPRSNSARFSSQNKNLQFLPRWFTIPAPLVLSLVGLISFPNIWHAFGSDTYTGRFQIRLVMVCFAALLVWTLWRMFRPLGLTLTPTGLIGVRGDSRIDISWDSLEEIAVSSVRKIGGGSALYLTVAGQRPVKVDARFTGTDINVLYQVIRYFLDHPDDRELLAEPEAALGRVEEFHRVG